MRRILTLVLLSAFAAACGGDSTGPGNGGGGGGSSNVIVLLSGDGQSGGTDGQVPAPLVVRVQTQNGDPVGGVAISWEITTSAGAGAQLLSPQGTSGADGEASAGLRLGDAPGAYEVAASISGGTVSFDATAQQRVPSALAIVSGDGQSGTVSQELANPFVVRVDDQFGDALAGSPVNFEISKGMGGAPSLSETIDATDAGGQATTTLTLGDKNGTYGVRALSGSDTASFSATASGGSQDLIGVTGLTPDPVTEGTFVTVDGTGFSTTPSQNSVFFDGVPGQIQTASATQITVLVPDFTALDQCLPRRDVDVQVAAGVDSASLQTVEVTPSGTPLSLSAGADSVFEGPSEVDCIQLPPASVGEEYEIVATPVPSAGFVSMRLHVNGRQPLGSPSVVPPPSTVTVSGGPASQSFVPAGLLAPQYALDRQLRELERARLGQIKRASAGTSFGLQSAAVPSVGDTITFQNSCFSGTITAVARSVSAEAAVFEDTVASGSYTTAEYDSIANNFDTVIFPTDTAYFGAPGDIDSNGRVIMLLTPFVNSLSPSYNSGVVAGFFCPVDIGSGNNAEMFYLTVPDPLGVFNNNVGPPGVLTKVFARRIIDPTVAHELQHMINAQIGGGAVTEAWINEGLSHLAEEVVGHATNGFTPGSELASAQLGADITTFNKYYIANFGNFGLYLASPTSAALLLHPDPRVVPATFIMRGASWAYVRYLLDQYSTPGTEAGDTRRLLQDGSGNAQAAVENTFGVDFERTVAEWNAMLGVEDRSDLGAPVRSELTLTSYQLRDVYDVLLNGRVYSGVSISPYPLAPPSAVQLANLDAANTIEVSVEAGSALFVRSNAGSGSGGTAIRLSDVGDGDLGSGSVPRLTIIRTK